MPTVDSQWHRLLGCSSLGGFLHLPAVSCLPSSYFRIICCLVPGGLIPCSIQSLDCKNSEVAWGLHSEYFARPHFFRNETFQKHALRRTPIHSASASSQAHESYRVQTQTTRPNGYSPTQLRSVCDTPCPTCPPGHHK